MYDSTRRTVHHSLPAHLWERLSRYAMERQLSTSDVLEFTLRRFFVSDDEDRLGELVRSARFEADYELPRAT